MKDEAQSPILLALPVPPMLEAALGYDGPARWVGFWWEPCGDTARWSDGRVAAGADWYAWRTFVSACETTRSPRTLITGPSIRPGTRNNHSGLNRSSPVSRPCTRKCSAI